MARMHSPDHHTLRRQTGTGEDDFIHLPSSPDHVACERQEEGEEEEEEEEKAMRLAAKSLEQPVEGLKSERSIST